MIDQTMSIPMALVIILCCVALYGWMSNLMLILNTPVNNYDLIFWMRVVGIPVFPL